MGRFLLAILTGIVGAGVVHIAVLMMVPSYSQRDAWSVLSERSNYYTLTRLDPAGQPPLIRTIDPLFNASACRFDLDEGVLHLQGEGDVPYWSVSVYDRTGQNIFSVNDNSNPTEGLDFVIATPRQMVELRNGLPPEFDGSVFIEADIGEGIVVLRAFTPDDSWENLVSSFLQGVSCTLR